MLAVGFTLVTRRVRESELFAAFENRLIEARSRFETDDQQVEDVGQAVLNDPAALADLMRQPQPGQDEADDEAENSDGKIRRDAERDRAASR